MATQEREQAGTAAGAESPALLARDEMSWGPMPEFFPAAGAHFCLLHGDPGAQGMFTVRLRASHGYCFAPHSHPHDEHLTIVSGTLLLGDGPTLDRTRVRALGPGSYVFLPRDQFHYAWAAEDDTVFQVNANGPFAITYANPEDDPRNAAAMKH